MFHILQRAEVKLAHRLLSPLLDLEVHKFKVIIVFTRRSLGASQNGLAEFVTDGGEGCHGLKVRVFELQATLVSSEILRGMLIYPLPQLKVKFPVAEIRWQSCRCAPLPVKN